MSTGLSENDRERLTQLKEANCQKGGGTRLTDCTDVRKRYKQGTPVPKLASEYDLANETIRKHLKGWCACDADVSGLRVHGDSKVPHKECPHGCGESYCYFNDLSVHIQTEHSGGRE